MIKLENFTILLVYFDDKAFILFLSHVTFTSCENITVIKIQKKKSLLGKYL